MAWERYHHRILLAEDNPFNQNFYRLLLEQYGCEVDAVASGASAVEAFGRKRYDLILMDCEMPGMDGYDATKIIRRNEQEAAPLEDAAAGEPRASRIPIIAVTGHAFKEARKKCLAVGMDDYLCKPFSIAQLGEKLKTWLAVAEREARGDAVVFLKPPKASPASRNVRSSSAG
jgi:CheY-like chemotaxis protein